MAKGRIEFDYQKCKACIMCVNFCPTKILELDRTQINTRGYHIIKVTDPEKCIGCGFCALMCPDSVITVYKTKETSL